MKLHIKNTKIGLKLPVKFNKCDKRMRTLEICNEIPHELLFWNFQGNNYCSAETECLSVWISGSKV